MNKTLTINMENLSEEERNLFVKLVEKSQQKKSKFWKPEENGKFYFLGPSGLINSSFYEDVNDEYKYLIGNCFHTEKEAKFIAEKLKVIAELKRIAKENNQRINWDNFNQEKYFLLYDYRCQVITIDHTANFLKLPTIYFSSIEGAKKAIETIGELKLKKYYFDIKE